MNAIEPVGFLPPAQALRDDLAGPATSGAASVTGNFAQWFSTQVSSANEKVVASEKNLQALATGEAESLHQVMLSLEEARLSLQMLAQVRSRVLEAYSELMRMQL